MAYAPIDSYGLIGNMSTAALVGLDGSIDWLCLPQFDSASVFGALLDERIGGRFQIRSLSSNVANSQLYWPDTNVLMTRLRSDEGVGEVIDFMPVSTARHDQPRRPVLVRRVRVHHGRLRIAVTCAPAFNYARDRHRATLVDGGVRFQGADSILFLSSTHPLEMRSDGSAHGTFVLQEGQTAVFALWYGENRHGNERNVNDERATSLLDDTVTFWHRWIGRCSYRGRWREVVQRSALTLKLLTFDQTGAIIAAPTCSLPEHLGGSRNWDYRYAWLRDAAFIVYAFLRIGFTDEAQKFMEWLRQRSHELRGDGILRPLYRVDGGDDISEHTLDHLEGYMGSRPVRIGNAAHEQLQMDVSGALLDAAYLHNKHAQPLSYDMWVELRKLLEWVCDNWEREDDGVWEVRGGRKHFVYSKLMCWVALDRGVRLATNRSFPGHV